jgi:hypothetical protein
MAYEKTHEIHSSNLTVEMLLEMANYAMDEEDQVQAESFSEEEIDELAEKLSDSVAAVVEDFLNHRKS